MECTGNHYIMSLTSPQHGQCLEITIVGRPNVGKSSLVNRLTRSHSAIVSDFAGTTLDVQHIPMHTDHGTALILDTAGWLDQPDHLMGQAMKKLQAVLSHTDWIWFVVDGRDALTPLDWQVRDLLVKLNKPIRLIVNKVDHPEYLIEPDIWKLGFEDMTKVSSKAGYNMKTLETDIQNKLSSLEPVIPETQDKRTRISLVGKPNAGKSTLFNHWVGDDIQIVSDTAGTTRDSNTYPIDCMGQSMLLVDTAGLRRNSKREGLERIFAQHAERCIKSTDVCVVLVRIDEGLTDQDSRLLRQVHESATGMVIALTQCDRLTGRHRQDMLDQIKDKLSVRYPMIDIIECSSREPASFKKIQKSIARSARSLTVEFNSSKLTKILGSLVEQVPPPCTSVSRIKPRFAHPVGDRGSILVRGKQLEDLPLSYKRYLEKGFLNSLNLVGRPIHIILKDDNNPYVTS